MAVQPFLQLVWMAAIAAAILCGGRACAAEHWVVYDGVDGPGKGKHVVLVSGDEEYRSEEALPQLGKTLAKHHGFKCTVLFAIDPASGTINPDNTRNIPGLVGEELGRAPRPLGGGPFQEERPGPARRESPLLPGELLRLGRENWLAEEVGHLAAFDGVPRVGLHLAQGHPPQTIREVGRVSAGVQGEHHVGKQLPLGRVLLPAEAALDEVVVAALLEGEVVAQLRLIGEGHGHADVRVVVAVAIHDELDAPVPHPVVGVGRLLEVERGAGHALPAAEGELDPCLAVPRHGSGDGRQIAPLPPTGRVVPDGPDVVAARLEEECFAVLLGGSQGGLPARRDRPKRQSKGEGCSPDHWPSSLPGTWQSHRLVAARWL